MISELYRSTMLTFREIYIRCWNFYRKYFDNSVYLYNYTLNDNVLDNFKTSEEKF